MTRARGHPEPDANQPPVRAAIDPWATDQPLRAHVAARAGAALDTPLSAFAARIGSAEARQAGRAANRHPPELRALDPGGRRIDLVDFHPGYHALMAMGIEAGYAALPWSGAAHGHLAHAAMVYMLTQIEPGVCCPMTMTYAAVPALAADPDLAGRWTPPILARSYDPAPLPMERKTGVTIGMAMTERQGGSDLRGTETRAEPCADGHRLFGQKWFCSAPMSDAFLTLARAEAGLDCFLVPRWLPDGTANGIRLERLKDKLGNRANASAEIAYDGALARRLGPEGAGIRTIMSMVHHTRLDTALAPAGLMRAALDAALHWCRHRHAFGRALIRQPLMRAVLADLALETEAALALALETAAAFDRAAAGCAEARAFGRLAVALAKFRNNRRAVGVVAEALEAHGGSGYVEEGPVALLYREAPLNAIWEGSGNVICLDVLRAFAREPEAVAALNAALDAARGLAPDYDRLLARQRARWPAAPEPAEARGFTMGLADCLAAACLLRGPAPELGAALARRIAAGDRDLAGGAGPLPEADRLLARAGGG